MVQVNRQTPPTFPQGNSAPGVASVLHRAALLADVNQPPLKLLIYGGNRTGKTWLACQWPKPLLIVSFEPSLSGGIETVRSVPGISLLQVRPDGSHDLKGRSRSDHYISLDESVTLVLDLRRSNQFKTVVYDGVTSSQDVLGANMLALPEVPDQRSWGSVPDGFYIERSEKFRAFIRPYLNLNIDTILLGKEKDHNPPVEQKTTKSGKLMGDLRPKFLRGVTDKSYVAPELGGAACWWIMDACEYVCRLYVGHKIITKTRPAIGQSPAVDYEEECPDEFVRYLRMNYHPNYAAGARADLQKVGNLPDEIVEPTYDKIIAAIRGTQR